MTTYARDERGRWFKIGRRRSFSFGTVEPRESRSHSSWVLAFLNPTTSICFNSTPLRLPYTVLVYNLCFLPRPASVLHLCHQSSQNSSHIPLLSTRPVTLPSYSKPDWLLPRSRHARPVLLRLTPRHSRRRSANAQSMPPEVYAAVLSVLT